MAEGSLLPGTKAGNVVDRVGMIAAIRTTLDNVSGRGGGAGKTRDLTIIVPDAAVRVLLLDFESLPGKPVEALPIVRFRLKKLLPFEVEDAVVSYQGDVEHEGAGDGAGGGDPAGCAGGV